LRRSAGFGTAFAFLPCSRASAACSRRCGVVGSLDLATLKEGYRSGRLTPGAVVAEVLRRIAARGDDAVWLSRVPEAELRRHAAELERLSPEALPLYGVPFAIKDNIDLAGLPTTAACPDFAYLPERSATVVERLVAVGAIPVGKTNLDQFATGLVGVRSPYGVPANPFDAAYIPGGSSSGSAVAVAADLVSFALGTDTAGSGRVPAAFCNLVGLKPSKGLLSTRGVVPACRTLDCVSIFALTAADAASVLAAAQGFDAADPFSRRAAPPAPAAGFAGLRVAVPGWEHRSFCGDREAATLYAAAVERLAALGARVVERDIAPFLEAARLLYEGPWVAERYLAVRDLLERRPEALHPVTRAIVAGGGRPSAADAFAAQYRLAELARAAEALWAEADVLFLPTAPTMYRLAEVEAEPFALNANLGIYTNFVNLLDLSAVAVPAGFRADGLPFGVTLLAPAFHDGRLLGLAADWQRALALPLGATGRPLPATAPVPAAAPVAGGFRLAVCGAHMSGLPLNAELTGRGGRLVERTATAPGYRLFALPGGPPERPGLVRAYAGGGSIEVEVWELPEAAVGGFVAGIHPPLGIGTLTLADGSQVKGFLCEAHAVAEAKEITALGGWRRHLAGG